MAKNMVRKSFPVGPLQCNCTVVGDSETGEGIVVDPGGDAELILKTLNDLKLKAVQIIHTHAHFDHIMAAGEIKEKTGAVILLHEEDLFLWDNLEKQCAMFGFESLPSLPKPDSYLQNKQDLPCCGGAVLHTPGHTPGSTSFWFEDHALLLAGDTLFLGSVGRTDLWGGNFSALENSIRNTLYRLNPDAVVVTGHGPETKLSYEKENNPFFSER